MLIPGTPDAMTSLISGGLTMVLGRLTLTSAGAGGVSFQMRSWLTPAPFWSTDFLASPGHSQFSQFTLITDNSTGIGNDRFRYGPGTLCQQNSPSFIGEGGGYFVMLETETGTLFLYRGLGSAGVGPGSTFLASSAAAVYVPGDVIRLETVVAAASNTNTVLVNGVAVIAANIDADPSRPKYGPPGIGLTFQGTNAIFATIDDYSGGPL
jgi:hypothetical protein